MEDFLLTLFLLELKLLHTVSVLEVLFNTSHRGRESFLGEVFRHFAFNCRLELAFFEFIVLLQSIAVLVWKDELDRVLSELFDLKILLFLSHHDVVEDILIRFVGRLNL